MAVRELARRVELVTSPTRNRIAAGAAVPSSELGRLDGAGRATLRRQGSYSHRPAVVGRLPAAVRTEFRTASTSTCHSRLRRY